MEILLEQEEVEELLREALESRGIGVPPDAEFRIRRNHKKGTLRVLFVGRPKKSAGSKPS